MAQAENKYYIWSRRHCIDRSHIWFWTANGKSYTRYLEEACIVGKEQKVHFKVLSTKRQISYAWNLNKYKDLDFLIPVDKVEILGLKRTIVGEQ